MRERLRHILLLLIVAAAFAAPQGFAQSRRAPRSGGTGTAGAPASVSVGGPSAAELYEEASGYTAKKVEEFTHPDSKESKTDK